MRPSLMDYHDREWGVPVHDDVRHFEFLVLEAAQAGLSWETVFVRRDAYRKAFLGFDPARVAAMSRQDEDALLTTGIIKNRAKIRAAINNAQKVCVLQDQEGSFDAYLWSFVGRTTKVGGWRSESEIPTTSDAASRLSDDLKRRGFAFVGPTICYAHLQACGLVMDHVVSCFRFSELSHPSG